MKSVESITVRSVNYVATEISQEFRMNAQK